MITQNKRIAARRLFAALLILSVGTLVGSCNKEEDDNALLPVLALSSAFTASNAGTCSFTFGSRTVPTQEYDLSTNTTLSFPNGFTFLFRNWVAIKIPSASDGMTLTFNFTPWYTAGGKTFYLVYNESACPIGNSSNADLNYTFPDLATERTPTNYTVSGNTLTFNSSAAGKSFVIVAATSSLTGNESVTRSVP